MEASEKLRGFFKDPAMAQDFVDTLVKLEEEFFVPGIRAVIRDEQAAYELKLERLEKESNKLRDRVFRMEQALTFKSQLVIQRLIGDSAAVEKKS